MSKKDEDKAISRGMYESIKSFISKFPDEDDLLLATASAKKVKSNFILSKYDLKDIGKYEKKFVKEHCKGLHDTFIFEKLTQHGDHEFIPALFWKRILKQEVL